MVVCDGVVFLLKLYRSYPYGAEATVVRADGCRETRALRFGSWSTISKGREERSWAGPARWESWLLRKKGLRLIEVSWYRFPLRIWSYLGARGGDIDSGLCIFAYLIDNILGYWAFLKVSLLVRRLG